MFLPLSTTIERTRPPGTYLEIMSAVFSLVVVLCYLLLGKYIQEKMGDTDEILVERNDSQSLKKLYSSERNDIVLYSIASLALPVLVYCLQNIFGAAEKQPEINPYLLPIALVVGPVIEEFLFRKVLYLKISHSFKHGKGRSTVKFNK